MKEYKIKNIMYNILPQKVRHLLIHIFSLKNRKKSNEDIFSKIYMQNSWQEDNNTLDKFYSGKGSDWRYSEQYVRLIKKFVVDNNINEIIDLGCGDFRIGSKFIDLAIKYTGIDIVPELIQFHKEHNSKSNINFICSDIVIDDLPTGGGHELCLVRQVLQHLSNKDICIILQKVKKYKYIVITEHLPKGDCQKPNLDKINGSHTRLFYDSGVYLEKEPFMEKCKLLLELPYDEKTILRTFLLISN